jgi:hypothetical protein
MIPRVRLLRPVPARRTFRAAIACVLALLGTGALGACGEKGGEKDPAREGIEVRIGGLDYNVYITRLLNLKDPEDRDYYRGREAPPGQQLVGVFLRVCNNEDEPARAVEEFEVVDTQENHYKPLEVPPDNLFAYRSRELAKDDCIPEAGSAAASSPVGGSLLIFQMPNSALENRPLELDIHGPGEPRHIELDL